MLQGTDFWSANKEQGLKVRLGKISRSDINETLYQVNEPGGLGQEQLLHLVQTDSFPRPGHPNCAPQTFLDVSHLLPCSSTAEVESGSGRKDVNFSLTT